MTSLVSSDRLVLSLSPQEVYEWMREGKIDDVDSELVYKIVSYVEQLEADRENWEWDISEKDDTINRLEDDLEEHRDIIKELEDEVKILRDRIDEM